MNLRPSERLELRVQDLLKKNREEGLSPDEEKEWERFEFIEHLVRMAKANAVQKLRCNKPTDA